ncbi:MAG: hypothetical protein ACKPKO_05520 [Candidatus Fonsibacter sp.]
MEEVDMIVQDTITNLGSLDIVLKDMRSSKNRGDECKEHTPQLADFGDQTWPRDPVVDVRASFPELQAVLLELAWRVVDHVAVQVHG